MARETFNVSRPYIPLPLPHLLQVGTKVYTFAGKVIYNIHKTKCFYTLFYNQTKKKSSLPANVSGGDDLLE